jgi:hypothetical protein
MNLTKIRNLGHLDQILRLGIGCALIYAGFIDAEFIQDPVSSYLVGAFGVVNILAALARYCPLYALVGINTARLD